MVEFDTDVLGLVHPYKRYVLGQTLRGRTQMEIAAKMEIAQPSVSYLIRTTLKRCRQYQPVVRPTYREVLASTRTLDDEDAKVVLAMWRHRQQSAAGVQLGRSQGYVRYRFLRSIPLLDDDDVASWFRIADTIEPRWEEVESQFPGRRPKRSPSPATLIDLTFDAL